GGPRRVARGRGGYGEATLPRRAVQAPPDTLPRPAPPPSGAEPIAQPRAGNPARISASVFTLLLVATLVAPVVLDTEPMPGLALMSLGLLLSAGFSHLIDASCCCFVLAVRFGWIAFIIH